MRDVLNPNEDPVLCSFCQEPVTGRHGPYWRLCCDKRECRRAFDKALGDALRSMLKDEVESIKRDVLKEGG